MEVDTVIIPYITIEERLILNLKPGFNNEDFLIDPASYFLNRKVRRVIFINGGENGHDYNPNDLPNLNPNPDALELDFSRMQRNEELENQIRNDESPGTSLSKESLNQLFVFDHSGLVTLKNVWLFSFFNLERNKKEIKQFKDFLYKWRIVLKCNNDLREILKDECKRGILKQGYDLLKGDFNNTSLCCLHSPINHEKNYFGIQKVNDSTKFRYIGSEYFRKERYNQSVGHMLTGDISLKTKVNRNEFIRHYKPFLNKIGVFLLPHHGANKNWHQNVLSSIRDRTFWIASAGFSNKFSHPGVSVISDILQEKHYFIKNHEFVSISGVSNIGM